MLISKKKFIELLEESFDYGYIAGLKTGNIMGKAEALGMGCILKGTKLEKEIEEIQKRAGF